MENAPGRTRAHARVRAHAVVVEPNGMVVDQQPFEGDLITHLPKRTLGRHGEMRIEWQRPDEAGKSVRQSPGTPAPHSPASESQDSRRATAVDTNLQDAGGDVNSGGDVRFSVSPEEDEVLGAARAAAPRMYASRDDRVELKNAGVTISPRYLTSDRNAPDYAEVARLMADQFPGLGIAEDSPLQEVAEKLYKGSVKRATGERAAANSDPDTLSGDDDFFVRGAVVSR